DLQVAAHARPELLLRDALAVGPRLGQRLADDRAALHVDEVLVVRAGGLVRVARRRVSAGVLLQERRVAARVVIRRAPRLRLGVDAGHDHDPVVVAGVVHRVLERVVLAHTAQPPVDYVQAARHAATQAGRGLARPQPVALVAGLGDRAPRAPQRLDAAAALADDAHLARAAPGDRRGERAGVGHLAAGGRVHRGVGRRVGPVRRTLEVG